MDIYQEIESKLRRKLTSQEENRVDQFILQTLNDRGQNGIILEDDEHIPASQIILHTELFR